MPGAGSCWMGFPEPWSRRRPSTGWWTAADHSSCSTSSFRRTCSCGGSRRAASAACRMAADPTARPAVRRQPACARIRRHDLAVVADPRRRRVGDSRCARRPGLSPVRAHELSGRSRAPGRDGEDQTPCRASPPRARVVRRLRAVPALAARDDGRPRHTASEESEAPSRVALRRDGDVGRARRPAPAGARARGATACPALDRRPQGARRR